MNKPELRIADFTETPGGRYRRLGPGSAEEFREEYLMPWLVLYGYNFTINFNGVYGYCSAFLEELFGGAIRSGVSPNDLIIIISGSSFDDDPLIKAKILEFILDASEALNLMIMVAAVEKNV